MLAKIFYLGAILEPMLFFLIADRTVLGFNLSLSRFFQFLVFFILIIKTGKIKSIENVFRGKNRYIIYFLGLIVLISSILGLLDGSYVYYLNIQDKGSINKTINLFNLEKIMLIIRPGVEFFLIIYLYWYHVSLGKYFSKEPKNIYTLISLYLFLMFASIFLGIVDISLKMIDDGNVSWHTWSISWGLLPRHFAEYFYAFTEGYTEDIISNTGLQRFSARFHGLFGEPRDAIPPLIAFLAILKFIEASDAKNLIKIRLSTYILISFCIISTASISGILTIPIFFCLYLGSIFIGIIKLNIRIMILFIFIPFLTIAIIMTSAFLDEQSKLFYYMDTYSNIFQKDLNSTFSSDEKTQLNNFYPLMVLNKLCGIDFSYKCLIGSGLGASGFANSLVTKSENLSYPFSDFVRIVFDIGILGIIVYSIFILLLGKTLMKLKQGLNKNMNVAFYFFMFTFASTLAHRSFSIWMILLFYISVNSIPERSLILVFDKIKKKRLFRFLFKQKYEIS